MRSLRNNHHKLHLVSLIIVIASVLLTVSCTKNPFEGMIIAELDNTAEQASKGGLSLIAFDPQNKKAPRILSEDFHSASSPALSSDASTLLFAGKINEKDSWQIWAMNLKKKEFYQVTNMKGNCFDPTYLPDGWAVFSNSGFINGELYLHLYKCKLDGTELQQLTFHPHNDDSPSVMQDGRILFRSTQVYPETLPPLLMIMRPDGTKCELFFKGDENSRPVGKASETIDGNVYFSVREENEAYTEKLMRLHQNRPVTSGISISENLNGECLSAIPWTANNNLIVYREDPEGYFALYEMETESNKLGTKRFFAEGNIIQPVLVEAIERPRILPSAVKPASKTGILLCQDIAYSALEASQTASGDSESRRIQVFGMNGILDEIEPESDGSVYLKLDADTPVRFVTVNNNGEVLRGPSAWIWLRPNERRGCIGCHEDSELAPENRRPMAVLKDPIVISSNLK